MKPVQRVTALLAFLLAASLLAACSGSLPQAAAPQAGPKKQSNFVAFTGIVEDINGSQWTVGGQTITLDSQTALGPNIVVGDEVKVEAHVLADGNVLALKVESPAAAEVVPTPSVTAAANTTETIASSLPAASSTPIVSSSSAAAPPAGGTETEVSGIVQALTDTAITVSGMTYHLTSATEFKAAIAVGDTVKLHVTVNADTTLTVREVEKLNANSEHHGSEHHSGEHDEHHGGDD